MSFTFAMSSCLTGFCRLEALSKAGYTAVESDYAGIAPSGSTLYGKTLAYELTQVSSDSFEYRVYRLDPKDKNPVNVDLYRLRRIGSFVNLEGPTEPSSGHHLADLPTHMWERFPVGPFQFPVGSCTTVISSSVSP
jgi:hypothetical protein